MTAKEDHLETLLNPIEVNKTEALYRSGDMTQQAPKPERRHRITLGELIALRLILSSIDTSIKQALTAENTSDRREALKVAQSQLKIAMELTRDSATL